MKISFSRVGKCFRSELLCFYGFRFLRKWIYETFSIFFWYLSCIIQALHFCLCFFCYVFKSITLTRMTLFMIFFPFQLFPSQGNFCSRFFPSKINETLQRNVIWLCSYAHCDFEGKKTGEETARCTRQNQKIKQRLGKKRKRCKFDDHFSFLFISKRTELKATFSRCLCARNVKFSRWWQI